MPYVFFHNYFPEIAEQETRNITVLYDPKSELPSGKYSFLEMFCDEPGCDCRRVFFCVVSSRSKDVKAVVTYGWEPDSFYVKWMRSNDAHIIAELKGPSLNLASRQSKHAPAILELVRDVLLKDTAYVERVKRHYGMFRSKIEGLQRNKRNKKA